MMDSLVADFRIWVGFEDFDKMSWIDLEIKSKEAAVLEKVKMPF